MVCCQCLTTQAKEGEGDNGWNEAVHLAIQNYGLNKVMIEVLRYRTASVEEIFMSLLTSTLIRYLV